MGVGRGVRATSKGTAGPHGRHPRPPPARGRSHQTSAPAPSASGASPSPCAAQSAGTCSRARGPGGCTWGPWAAQRPCPAAGRRSWRHQRRGWRSPPALGIARSPRLSGLRTPGDATAREGVRGGMQARNGSGSPNAIPVMPQAALWSGAAAPWGRSCHRYPDWNPPRPRAGTIVEPGAGPLGL